MAAVVAITVAASFCGSAECEQILVRWREKWDTVKERVKSPQALLSISTIYKLKLLLAPLRPILARTPWQGYLNPMAGCESTFLTNLRFENVC